MLLFALLCHLAIHVLLSSSIVLTKKNNWLCRGGHKLLVAITTLYLSFVKSVVLHCILLVYACLSRARRELARLEEVHARDADDWGWQMSELQVLHWILSNLFFLSSVHSCSAGRWSCAHWYFAQHAEVLLCVLTLHTHSSS